MKSMLINVREERLEHMVLESFLVTNESLITHRRRYRAFLQMQTVLDLLLTDETNPRSLAFQIDRLQRNLARLPRPRGAKKLSADEKFALEVATQLRLADTGTLARASGADSYRRLLDLTAFIESRLMQISEALTQAYFSHAQGARQLVPTRRKAIGK
jgi:uncharacterized alpha-E superfamily protein